MRYKTANNKWKKNEMPDKKNLSYSASNFL